MYEELDKEITDKLIGKMTTIVKLESTLKVNKKSSEYMLSHTFDRYNRPLTMNFTIKATEKKHLLKEFS